MKILWLTNFLMPDHAMALGHTPSPRGGWMPALAEALVDSGQVTLAVATNVPGAIWRQDAINGVRYYTLPCPRGSIHRGRLPVALVKVYQRAVEDFRPDVIHIHGTEYFQGLLTGRGYLKYPTVISIQGLLNACHRHYWGGISFAELLSTRTLRDWVRLDGLFEQRFRMFKRSKVEREIFASNAAFIGRTRWDQAHTRKLNPRARYYHCDELIRHPFYDTQWEIERVDRHTIFVSGASYPLKGFHVLVKAAGILCHEFPDIQIRTPLARFYPEVSGVKRHWKNCRVDGYARYLNNLIRNEGLEKQVVSLSTLTAEDMTNELSKAHAFVLPSLIENSPNSLAEAMLVGTPSVASFVGGVPSMVHDGDSALLFPPGDETVLAEHIRRIFLDDRLAQGLSVRAREVSQRRHSKETIVNDMLDIYMREGAVVQT